MLQETAPPAPDVPSSADYGQVRRALAFLAELAEQGESQPVLDRVARHLGLTVTACDALFERWCGLGFERFADGATARSARALLAGASTLFDTAPQMSAGRPRTAPIIQHDAILQGSPASRGKGLDISFGFHGSPFGTALLMTTHGALAGLAFVDEDAGGSPQDALADMKRRWPMARFSQAPPRDTASLSDYIFAPDAWRADRPIRLALLGTEFDTRVWTVLLGIPMGRAVSYIDIARHIGRPSASRAVGSAVGRNPISFVVPCHRVLRTDGALGGYHWGLTRKRAMLGWETARCADVVTASRSGLRRA